MRVHGRSPDAWPRTLAKSAVALVAFCLGGFAAAWCGGDAARAAAGRGVVGAALPRFESLRSDSVALRNGPGRDYSISWILTREGLPVEVLRETDGWRQIRDADGTTGWVPGALLSRQRTAVIVGEGGKSGRIDGAASDRRPGLAETDAAAPGLGRGELVAVASCDGAWCEIAARDARTRVRQGSLWGVYPGERLR